MTGCDPAAGGDRPVRAGLHAVPGQGVPQGVLHRRVQERGLILNHVIYVELVNKTMIILNLRKMNIEQSPNRSAANVNAVASALALVISVLVAVFA